MYCVIVEGTSWPEKQTTLDDRETSADGGGTARSRRPGSLLILPRLQTIPYDGDALRDKPYSYDA